VSETVTVASLAEKLRNAKEKIKEEAKDLDELRETARQLHDALCWGNRKDIGKKFPRTPLTQEEYNEKARALHEEGWVKAKDLEALLGDFEGDFARLQKQLVSGTAFRTLLAELEDQKYEVSENSGLFVVDFVDVLKAIGNFKEQILGGEAEK
jgi:hypothetical protein